MIAVLIALILALAPATAEAPAHTEAQVVQTERAQALEASAWESLDLIESIDIITEDSIVDYSHTVTVEDGTYSILSNQFAVVDPYDNVYVHIFTVDALYHA